MDMGHGHGAIPSLVLHVISECHYLANVMMGLCGSRELASLKPFRCIFSLSSFLVFRVLNRFQFHKSTMSVIWFESFVVLMMWSLKY